MKKISQLINNVKSQTSRQAIIPLHSQASEKELKDLVVFYGKQIVPKFKLIDEFKPIYAELFYYFTGNPKSKYDLNKGIALIGTYGIGKTTVFRIFHEFIKQTWRFCPNLFIVSSVEDLSAELNQKSWLNEKLTYYIHENSVGYNEKKPKHVLINEFGYQYKIKNFGTDVNELIEAWLMKRYDIFQEYKKLTHITSNFGMKDLESNFHPKIIDRFKEMFNFIPLEGKSFRK